MSTVNLRYDNRVALVTGAGRGLGREYALLLASRGAKVIVNDLGGSYDGITAKGTTQRIADVVVSEIQAAGGQAVANYDSVVDGGKVIEACIQAYGRLDIVIANAGILTPETFQALSLDAFERTLRINVTGVFSIVQAAWPHLVKQKYGRIIMITSPALFGAGVPAYSASKAALVGLSNSIQFEAKKLRPKGTYDIKCNAIIPFASTRMTNEFAADVALKKKRQGKKLKPNSKTGPDTKQMNARLTKMMDPSNVAAMVGWLCHENCTNEATIHEAGAGYFSQIRFERSQSLFVTEKEGSEIPLIENIRDGQSTLNTWDGDIVATGDGTMGGNPVVKVMTHLSSKSESKSQSQQRNVKSKSTTVKEGMGSSDTSKILNQIVDLHVKPGMNKQLEKVTSFMALNSCTQEGILVYHICQDPNDKDHYFFIEIYKSEAALLAKRKTEWFKQGIEQLKKLISKPPVVTTGKGFTTVGDMGGVLGAKL
tara:strand:+ start:36 stop:1481 length:1446 start_codon:yes stop_codon:yes gene_type:complete